MPGSYFLMINNIYNIPGMLYGFPRHAVYMGPSLLWIRCANHELTHTMTGHDSDPGQGACRQKSLFSRAPPDLIHILSSSVLLEHRDYVIGGKPLM